MISLSKCCATCTYSTFQTNKQQVCECQLYGKYHKRRIHTNKVFICDNYQEKDSKGNRKRYWYREIASLNEFLQRI